MASDDLRYLAKLADWCAGQGFCQIEGLKDPEEWCTDFWDRHGGTRDYSADALADAVVKQSLTATPVTEEVRERVMLAVYNAMLANSSPASTDKERVGRIVDAALSALSPASEASHDARDTNNAG